MKTLLLSLLLLASNAVLAGPPDYDDLRILYADGNYEKLIRAGEKYTNSDKTKNDAKPYFWMARGLYEISFKTDRDEKYKNAFKDAINYLGQFIKKDKSKELQNDEEFKGFVVKFKDDMVESILSDIIVGDYKKMVGNVSKYRKLMVTFCANDLMEGAVKFRNNDKSGGSALIKAGEKALEKLTDFETLQDPDKKYLMHAIIQTAEVYKLMKQPERAKAILARGAQWFETNEDWKVKYDEIVN